MAFLLPKGIYHEDEADSQRKAQLRHTEKPNLMTLFQTLGQITAEEAPALNHAFIGLHMSYFSLNQLSSVFVTWKTRLPLSPHSK